MTIDQNLHDCLLWYGAADIRSPSPAVSESRDLFNTRLGRMASDMEAAGANINSLSLLAAVVGEIGNNCFDHNLGQWRDQPGCWLGFDVTSGTARFWIADRGQGIRVSLARVLPDLKDDQEALEVAFRRVISGRAPERRGNGLKFVRSVINGDDEKGLYCNSGDGRLGFGGAFERMAAEMVSYEIESAPGVLTYVEWKLS